MVMFYLECSPRLWKIADGGRGQPERERAAVFAISRRYRLMRAYFLFCLLSVAK
jgi:hypothetical protein